MTQAELAERTGVSLRMIRAYEQGTQDISKAESASVFRLANALGTDAVMLQTLGPAELEASAKTAP